MQIGYGSKGKGAVIFHRPENFQKPYDLTQSVVMSIIDIKVWKRSSKGKVVSSNCTTSHRICIGFFILFMQLLSK